MAIVAEGRQVGVAWSEERTSATREEFRFAFSADGGNHFREDVQVGRYRAGAHDVDRVTMGLSGGTFVFAWRDNRAGVDQVFATTAPRGVLVDAEDVRVGPSGSTASHPRVAVRRSGEDVRMAVSSQVRIRGKDQTFLTRSLDGGGSWSDPERLRSGVGRRRRRDHDAGELVFNELYGEWVSVWLGEFGTRSSRDNRLHFAASSVHDVRAVSADDGVRFEVQNFGEDASAVVLLSAHRAPTPLGDGRSVNVSIQDSAWFGSPFSMTGPLDAGSGRTPPIPPAALWAWHGLELRYAAVGLDAEGRPSSVTRVRTLSF